MASAYFAGMIAHQCDSTHTQPTKPEGYDEESEGGGGGGWVYAVFVWRGV